MEDREPAVEKKKKKGPAKVDLKVLYNNTVKEPIEAEDWPKVLRTCGASKLPNYYFKDSKLMLVTNSLC
jgi:hypothetical protein